MLSDLDDRRLRKEKNGTFLDIVIDDIQRKPDVPALLDGLPDGVVDDLDLYSEIKCIFMQ